MENHENRDCLTSGASTTANCVEEVLGKVREELRQLYVQRSAVQRRIGAVKKTMMGLAAMFGDDALRENALVLRPANTFERKPGFTRACRSVLRRAHRALSAGEVHDQLQQESPALLSALKQPRTAVTTVLNRLADYGEARRVSLNNGRRGWEWVEADTTSAGSDKDARSLVPVEVSDGSTALGKELHPTSLS